MSPEVNDMFWRGFQLGIYIAAGGTHLMYWLIYLAQKYYKEDKK